MKLRNLPMLLLLLAGSGCASMETLAPPEVFMNEATLATKTKTEQLLQALPAGKQPLVVAVYQFGDQTGQNKPGETPQYSRAVTQGGLSILKKALLDAGNNRWFRVVERGNLDDLLQERKIIRAMREEYLGPNGQKLPPLNPMLYAGMIIEGGIVAYDSNVMTGGIGARYLGIGGSTEYSRDMVTSYLRLVSVSTGEVLLSVSTSKTIFSTGVSGGAFKFVSYDNLLETEAGVTFNEPPQLAVRQSIELGVYALIMEGFRKNLWQFADGESGMAAFAQYRERYLKETDGEAPALAANPAEGASAARAFQSAAAPQSSVSGAAVSSVAAADAASVNRSRSGLAATAALVVPVVGLQEADELLRSGAAGAAEQAYRSALRDSADSSAVHTPLVVRTAAAALLQGRVVDSRTLLLDELRAAIKGGTSIGSVIVLLGLGYEAEGDYERAAKWYRMALSNVDRLNAAEQQLIKTVTGGVKSVQPSVPETPIPASI